MIQRLLNEIEFQLDMLRCIRNNKWPLTLKRFYITSNIIKNTAIQNGDIGEKELLFKPNMKCIEKMNRTWQKYYLT